MVGRMLKTYLIHEQLYQVVDLAAWGQNEGGVYLSLFSSKANYRICNVYSEKFRDLPAALAGAAPTEVGHEVPTDKKRAADKGYIFEIPKMGITRYKMNPDDDKDKWRFAETLWVSGNRPVAVPPPAALPREQAGDRPAFANRAAALEWAVNIGGYANTEEALAAYEAVTEGAQGAADAFGRWMKHVNEGLQFRGRQKRAAAAAQQGKEWADA